MKLLKIPSLLALGALPFVASAGTQTIPFSFTPSGAVVLTFNEENYDAVDITSITVSVTMTASGGSLSGDNDSSTEAGTYNAESGVTAVLAHSGGPAALFTTGFASVVGATLSATDTTTGTLAVDDGDTEISGGDGSTAGFDVGGSDYFTFDIVDSSDSDSGEIDSSQYSNYLGTGTYTITVTAAQFQSIAGVGGVAALSIPADLSGSVTVTVVPDTVVPEPGTYALIAGLCAFSWIAIRRRK
jgi:hypothetical protein